MNYGVPAEKMGEFLYTLVNSQKTVEKPQLDADTQMLILAVLKDGKAKDPTPPPAEEPKKEEPKTSEEPPVDPAVKK